MPHDRTNTESASRDDLGSERLRPTVSVILPTYDRLPYLRLAVDSVFAQTFTDWELIVADDGSSEETTAYLRGLESPTVRVLFLARSGNPSRVRNAALGVANGRYVAFLDSDDLWLPLKLERQLAFMLAQPGCEWSYTAFTIVDAEGVPLSSERNRRWIPHSGNIFTEVVRTSASIRTPAVVVSTKLMRDVGGFDEAIERSEDYDLWTRLALRSPICVVDEPLVLVRRHAGNQTTESSAAYVARDYSLRKLARHFTGAPRRLLEEERSRNALALAADVAARGGQWRAVAAVGKSLPFSWKYPRWWYGAARALARACLAAGRARGAR
jgi:glycosyltransferase involved in cell wall biosynthesis